MQRPTAQRAPIHWLTELASAAPPTPIAFSGPKPKIKK